MRFGLVAMVLVVAAGTVGCRKGDAEKRSAEGGSVVLVGPDGAPLVGPALVVPLVPGASSDAPEIGCRVAIRQPNWGPGGKLGGLQFKLRTVHARGSREQVLELARRRICDEDGIPAEQCTPDLFLPEYEWCDGDPRSTSRPSPEIQQLADKIRAGSQPPPPDAGPAVPAPDAAPPPADAPEARAIVF
jgi:hypothetical protein